MLFHEQPSDPWVPFDFLLLEAYQTLEDETCNECGNPVWVCRNEEASNVGFKIKTGRCFGKAELDKWMEKDSKKKTTKKSYGEYPYIVAYTYDNGPLPSRSDYFQSLAARDSV
jgi:hypothetical protein